MSRKSGGGSADASALRIEPAASLEAAREEWQALALRSGNVFSTWEWASTWWQEAGKGRELLVSICRLDGGRAAAILPLYAWSARLARIARFIGHGPADELGAVCAPGDRARAAAALPEACRQAGVDLLLAELLRGDHGWTSAFGVRPLQRESSPTLSLPGGWEGYLATRSANLRQQVRRRERTLTNRYDVRFRLASDPAGLQDDLNVLLALHAARWGERSPFIAWERFHRAFAPLALALGWLRLWFLELDGKAAAAWYGFRYAGVESYYQAGRDPQLADASVGFVLLAHSIRSAAEDGMREYRFLRGAEPFKFRFADADPGLETYGLAFGAKGRGARLAASAGLRSSAMRSLVRRGAT